MDPLFNLREIAKQLLLVEDHLQHSHKVCPDCLRKHLLTCEALAEEAITLDDEQANAAGCEMLAEQVRRWLIDLADEREPREIAQSIRSFRKKLVPYVYDPRGIAARVASVYIQRTTTCPHIR
jgi:hypothetical protein